MRAPGLYFLTSTKTVPESPGHCDDTPDQMRYSKIENSQWLMIFLPATTSNGLLYLERLDIPLKWNSEVSRSEWPRAICFVGFWSRVDGK